jgi:hypothetical protein
VITVGCPYVVAAGTDTLLNRSVSTATSSADHE